MDELRSVNAFQNIILENREKLNITGIRDLLSFDDRIIIIETELGLLTVKGENLKISKLSLDSSDFSVDGEISSLTYSDHENVTKKGFLNKIFK